MSLNTHSMNTDWPLAVCDGRTIKEHDLVASDNIRRNNVGENLFARYSPNYRWHYLSNQEKDEVFLLKIYDSKPDVIKCEKDSMSSIMSVNSH
jgi:hypothetical protein